MQFRKDLNGLRAFAVIAVMLFHFNGAWLPGGFAGVDVFFVISGFLMTGIIFRGIEQENFSILTFYVARASRVIPALAVLCLVLLVFGWFFLAPFDYKLLAEHVVSSVGFFSNIVYWMESGYFDAASHGKWLLHTWSLSAEWQFYIIYPLLLVAMRKLMPISAMKLFVLVATVLGFLFCVVATYKWPNPAYFLLPTRTWEMMIGGVAYLYPLKLQKRHKKVLELLGLVLILGSYVFFSKESLWPGYWALFPVLGAFLVISAQRDDSYITGNVLAQKLGAWSYSIYLWHWPLVVIIFYFSLSDIFVYVGMCLSIIFGFLSHKYIEKIKFKKVSKPVDFVFFRPLLCAVFVGLLGLAVLCQDGFLNGVRLSHQQVVIARQMEKNESVIACGSARDGVSPSCRYGVGPIKAIVIGDSHAQAQLASISERAAKYGGSILDWTMAGCQTVSGLYRVGLSGIKDYNCGELVDLAIQEAGNKYPDIPIIIINRTSVILYGRNEDDLDVSPDRFVDKEYTERSVEYRDNVVGHMIGTICKFSETNPVYLVRPTPEMGRNVPKSMFVSTLFGRNVERVSISEAEHMERQALVFKMQDSAVLKCGTKLIDPLAILCGAGYCYGDEGGVPLYFDDDHLSIEGAQKISPVYDEVFQEWRE